MGVLNIAEVAAAGGITGFAPYLGPVATGRARLPTTSGGTNKQCMSRTFHYARDNITALKLVLGNWIADTSNAYGGAGGEVGTGAAATYTASIEYPEAVFTQVTLAGSPTMAVPDKTQIVTDFASVTIPRGAKFWVRMWANFPGALGIPYCGVTPKYLAGGDAFGFGTTRADQTMGGTVTDTNTSIAFGPLAILGMTTRPSFWIGIDSRCFGQGDTADVTGDTGELGRSLGGDYGYINCGVPSMQVSNLVNATKCPNMQALMAYGSHGISQGGINDLNFGGVSPANLAIAAASLATIWGTSRPLYLATLAPTSSGTFTSDAGQTAGAAAANIGTYNNNLRGGGIVGISGVIDISDVLSSARDSSKWTSLSGIAHTGDGLHANTRGYRLVHSSGVVRGIVSP
jgi:hypothetical protein